MLRQQHDVVDAIAQGRYFDPNRAEPEIEVLTQQSAFNGLA